LSLCAAAGARAATIATFSDPAQDGSTPLFTVDVSASQLSGSWTGSGLDLIVPIASTVFNDATFVMDPVTFDPNTGTLGAGGIRFFDNMQREVLRVSFDSGALFEPFGFGASFIRGDSVIFSSDVISLPPLREETFAFGFSNRVDWGDTVTYTAAFTASAIPEPASLGLITLGAIAMLRLPKRR